MQNPLIQATVAAPPVVERIATSLARPRVVVLGSGWASFNFLRTINKTKFDVKAISPANHYLFTPLLPSVALGTVEFRAIQEPIRTIKGMERNFFQAKAQVLDSKRKVVLCQDIFKSAPFEVPYDFLVLGTGFKTNTFNIASVAKHEGHSVFFLKHLFHARLIRNRILECFERASIHMLDSAERDRLLTFIVDVSRYYPTLKPHIRIILVEAGERLISSFDANLVSYIQRKFTKEGIDVRLKTAVRDISEDGKECRFSDGRVVPFGMMVWNAGIAPLKVKGDVRSLFAFGDCAAVEDAPLPQLAQVAQQQGKYLAKVFNAAAWETPAVHPPPADAAAEDAKLEFTLEEEADHARRVEAMERGLEDKALPFRYFSLGSMATLGGFRGVADFTHVGNPSETTANLGTVKGFFAFVMWRTAYLGRQVSIENKVTILFYWIKTWIWGRDISRF